MIDIAATLKGMVEGDDSADERGWVGISEWDVLCYQLSGGDATRFWNLLHLPRAAVEVFAKLQSLDVRLNRG